MLLLLRKFLLLLLLSSTPFTAINTNINKEAKSHLEGGAQANNIFYWVLTESSLSPWQVTCARSAAISSNRAKIVGGSSACFSIARPFTPSFALPCPAAPSPLPILLYSKSDVSIVPPPGRLRPPPLPMTLSFTPDCDCECAVALAPSRDCSRSSSSVISLFRSFRCSLNSVTVGWCSHERRWKKKQHAQSKK